MKAKWTVQSESIASTRPDLLRRWVLFATLLACSGSAGYGDDGKALREQVASLIKPFETAWEETLWVPESGRMSRYLRPASDRGWVLRMEALQAFAKLGPAASPALCEVLRDGEPAARGLAAQALGYLGDPAAQRTLAAAVERDADPVVRLYAADSLGMLGGTDHHALLQQRQKDEKVGDVQRHLAYALERNGEPVDPKVVERLRTWKMAGQDTAQPGQPAPDFTLPALDGTAVRLSDFRGKSAVVLVFVYGDT